MHISVILDLFHQTIAIDFLHILCMVMALESAWANVPFKNIKFHMFSKRTTEYETTTAASLKLVGQFFAGDAVDALRPNRLNKTDIVRSIDHMSVLFKVNELLLKPNSEWLKDFYKTIDASYERSAIQTTFIIMDATRQSMQNKLLRLHEINQSNVEIRKINAKFIHRNLQTLLNYFDENDGIFNEYPLESAPLLINLALIIATFTPLANSLIPRDVKRAELACKAKHILIDYRTRAVILRAQKLNSISVYYKEVASVFGRLYNSLGYDDENSGILHCDPGCIVTGYIEKIGCLVDQFGTEKYHFSIAGSQDSFTIGTRCISEYVGLMRYRMENMFPVALMDQVCIDSKPRKPNGKSFRFFFFFGKK